MIRLPPHADGMRIGLYGGSFNPPHAGHLHVSRTALRRAHLDRVWWLVSPGNPLKANRDLPPVEIRLDQVRKLVREPRIMPTGLEAETQTRFTLHTVRALKARAPGVRFVWIMGADSLIHFHRWRGWRSLAEEVPLLVVDRPGFSNRALRSRAAIALAGSRLDESDAKMLAALRAPVWAFLHGPRSELSSTVIRMLGS